MLISPCKTSSHSQPPHKQSQNCLSAHPFKDEFRLSSLNYSKVTRSGSRRMSLLVMETVISPVCVLCRYIQHSNVSEAMVAPLQSVRALLMTFLYCVDGCFQKNPSRTDKTFLKPFCRTHSTEITAGQAGFSSPEQLPIVARSPTDRTGRRWAFTPSNHSLHFFYPTVDQG